MSDGADVDREKAVRATLRVVLPRAPVGTFGDVKSLRQDMQVQRTRSAPKSPHAENLDVAARTLASPVGPDTPSRISRERSRKPSVPSDTDRVDHHPSESPRPFLRPTTPVRVVSLETRLAELRSAQKRISPPSTAAIMYQLTRAVAHAAGLGVCHGDITPSCVLLSVPSMHISLTGMCTDSGTRSVCFLPPASCTGVPHACYEAIHGSQILVYNLEHHAWLQRPSYFSHCCFAAPQVGRNRGAWICPSLRFLTPRPRSSSVRRSL